MKLKDPNITPKPERSSELGIIDGICAKCGAKVTTAKDRDFTTDYPVPNKTFTVSGLCDACGEEWTAQMQISVGYWLVK